MRLLRLLFVAVIPLSASAAFMACGSSKPPAAFDLQATPDGAGLDSPLADAGQTFNADAPDVAVSRDPETCEEAKANRSYVGCDFWPTVVANGVWSIFDFAVVVANTQRFEATVTVTRDAPSGTGGDAGDAGDAGTFSVEEKIPPGELRKIYLPWVKDLKGVEGNAKGEIPQLDHSVLSRKGAYHLVSSIPVVVNQFNALEYRGRGGPPGKDWSTCPGLTSVDGGRPIGCFSFSNDASLLLPSTALSGNYRVTGQVGQSVVSQGITFPIQGPYVAVTATEDNTSIDVRLSTRGNVLASPRNEIPSTPGGGLLTLRLDRGDVAQIVASPGQENDLSGSLIKASKPVQVIAGVPCIQHPQDKAACDHIEESVFPAETLGKQYVVTMPSAPGNTTPGHIVRFYGNVDNTKLIYIPSAPPGCPGTIQAGQVIDCGIVRNDFEVRGDHEFAVGTFMLGGELVDPTSNLGDPSQSLIVPVDQYRTQYTFLAPDDYVMSFIDIVIPRGVNVFVDTQPVDVSLIKPVAQASTFDVGRVRLGPGKGGAHTVTASGRIGIQILGYGQSTSYQYPGGLNLGQIAPPPAR